MIMVILMRTFYIFNVNKEMEILTKDSPYVLFKSFESIHNTRDLYMAQNLYEQLANRFNKSLINQKIATSFKDNQFYMYVNNHHTYYNKYRDERCEIEIKNSYLICNCNTLKVPLLKKLNDYNLFACDFENKDYFWLDEICC